MANDARIDHCEPDGPDETLFFDGTIVPVKRLFKYLADGKSLDQFLRDHPFITREQVSTAFDRIVYPPKKASEPSRPVFRWLFGAGASPVVVAFVYLLFTEWTKYPYRNITDYGAAAVGIGVGAVFLWLLPVHWGLRGLLSLAYVGLGASLCYCLAVVANTVAGWPDK
jgi:hypothetical protein